MTAPTEPTPVSTESVALLALEAQVEQQAQRDLAALSVYAAALVVAIATDLDESSTSIFSKTAMHAALIAALDQSKADSSASIKAAYRAGAQLGVAAAVVELAGLGYTGNPEVTDFGDYLDVLLRDVDTMFADALPDIHNTVRARVDAATGEDRMQAARDAIEEVTGRLLRRLSAARAVAVHRGYTEGQRAVWDDYSSQVNPYIAVRKVWRTNGVDPCTECAALDGTTVGFRGEFPYNADPAGRHLPVHRDLFGPPRHPHCRCRITLET